MNVGFLGSTVMDHLIMQGKERLSPGGIFYSVACAKAFKNSVDNYYLITSFAKHYRDELAPWFDEFNLEYSEIGDVMPEVYLTTFPDKEREERYENFSSKSVFTRWIPQLDALYINMITGFDITLDELIELRRQNDLFVYLDVHSLARGVTPTFERPFRLIPRVKEWLSSVDILQANESELLMLGEGRNREQTIEFIFETSPNLILVNTLGEQGARVYSFDNEKIVQYNVEPFPGSNVNAIGCGDVFGAAFFLSYFEDRDLLYSAKIASAAGASITEYSSIFQLRELKKDVINRIA